MGKIQKGFALSTAIISTLCLVFGIAISICAWVIQSKVPSGITTVQQQGIRTTESFHPYWWGGIFFTVPGILGLIAGCTRNVVTMVFFLVFNLICLLCSLAVSVLGALAIVIWSQVNEKVQDENICSTLYNNSCECTIDSKIIVIHDTTCENLYSIQTVLGAMVAMASISSLLAFIASYISCCALCNQENDNTAVIIQQGPGAYQPPAMVVSHTNNSMMSSGYPAGAVYPPPGAAYPPPGAAYAPYSGYPPQYSQQEPYYPTGDKSNLVKNEVI
ncbi:uncharacterized protein LOC130645230 [Hydractinia symbiolongicarpus]|uniref:uncharacterized protein LOC130645230 n=1 Tax=Hydractinia symbiolongicarpus TaxID=13093 RepID=UPI00254DB0E1|nr:uncharacterized protein LOC130645230 [Hydractinia symbiolongicarpus]